MKGAKYRNGETEWGHNVHFTKLKQINQVTKNQKQKKLPETTILIRNLLLKCDFCFFGGGRQGGMRNR